MKDVRGKVSETFPLSSTATASATYEPRGSETSSFHVAAVVPQSVHAAMCSVAMPAVS